MEVISSLSELEAKIAECNDLLTHHSDDAMRRLFNTFRMDFSAEAPEDPFSPDYARFQMDIYRAITGKAYEVRNERSNFDTAGKAACPFPYYLRSAWTAGHQLLAIGFMLCKFRVPSGSRILEFGPGWGNTTMELARLGYDVTAIDIDTNFCDVVRERAKLVGVSVSVLEGDFFHAEQVEQPYDAVLFFACFHHCHDHVRLLRALHRAVLPGGRVYLGSEPIIPEYGTPWGVRMDGEALWAARNFGWLELGFDEDYFKAALALTGWHGTKHHCETVPWASVWELERLSERPPVDQPAEPAAEPVETELPPAPALTADPESDPDPGERAIRELDALYRSTSWRVTRPLRAVKRLLSHKTPGKGR